MATAIRDRPRSAIFFALTRLEYCMLRPIVNIKDAPPIRHVRYPKMLSDFPTASEAKQSPKT